MHICEQKSTDSSHLAEGLIDTSFGCRKALGCVSRWHLRGGEEAALLPPIASKLATHSRWSAGTWQGFAWIRVLSKHPVGEFTKAQLCGSNPRTVSRRKQFARLCSSITDSGFCVFKSVSALTEDVKESYNVRFMMQGHVLQKYSGAEHAHHSRWPKQPTSVAENVHVLKGGV